jgi:serine/threonine protein kinase
MHAMILYWNFLSLLSLYCTQVEQLHRIFRLCGSPSEDYWKIMKLPTSFRPPQHYKPSFEETFSTFPTSSFGLLTTLLALDPTSRGSAASALESEVSKHGKFFLCSHYNVVSLLLSPFFFYWLTKTLE